MRSRGRTDEAIAMYSFALQLDRSNVSVRTKFDNLSKVAKISCRKLFLHSRADEIIPFEMGERLFAAAAEPKESVWFTGCGHNEMTISRARKFYSTLATFLEPFGK